ncbi:hypothetical protein DAETH_16190 [Deinococcus aetherius]|uniref:Uncharacterized protein n=1 Tax=Deinococcus aetherius TaxID=200252 RepID=A0ABM8ACX6_9DEIO|nr:hypothetical protein [Deinococcus aetherius]BDP41650.1 hypothetical protein DAETH_16190 [Deinococcus aetherius]
MTAVLLLLVIFGGIALITYVDNTTRAGRRAARLPPGRGEALPAAARALPAPEPVESLLLRLPEPQRTRTWAILCAVADAQAAPGTPDARTAYLLAETRRAYLPDTVRAYLGLTDGARERLAEQGQPADTLLTEQLALIEDGVREALRHDHAAADRLMTQGRFLRERFQAEGGPGGWALPDVGPKG